ncbi:MAG: InlB B-repeat-containing protein, partial [Clostridia bacterium]|nr:InlB B-repeat-containing protein [Clostridia bacterium]
MTRKLLSIALAAVMVLALVPMSVFAKAFESIAIDRVPVEAEGRDPAYDVLPGSSVTFTGDTYNVTDPQVGDTFYWYFTISENSNLANAVWTITYDTDYLTLKNTSATFSGGIMSLINAQHDEEDFSSDKIDITINDADPGTVSAVMYTKTFAPGIVGVNVAGQVLRLKFEWKAVPESSATIPVGLVNNESYIFQVNETGGIEHSYVYEDVTTTPGSINVTVSGPAPTEEPTPEPTAEPTPEPTAAPSAPAVTYTGETVTDENIAVGDMFFWKISVSAASSLYSGNWLIEYDHRFLTCASGSVDWSGSLTTQIYNTWDDEEAYSDKPSFVFNINYEGQTGNNPLGETGKWYNVLGMYITSFQYNGVQMGGDMARFKFQWTAIPGADDLQHDEVGDYLPLPITVLESKYFVTVSTGQPHTDVTVIDGKVYVTVPQEYTLTINYQYADGTEANEPYTATLEAGSEYSVESPAIEGYTPDPAVVSGTLNENTTVIVTYNPNNYTITYTVNGEAYTTQTYAYGAAVTAPEYEVPEGHTFSGWTVPETMPAQDLTLDATLTVNEYTITYTVNGEAYTTQTYAYGA